MLKNLEKNISKVYESSLSLSLVTAEQRKSCLNILSRKLDLFMN